MSLNRRTLLKSAAALPFALQSVAQQRTASPLPPLSFPGSLPDKASFPHVPGAYLDGAAQHARPIGANVLIHRAASFETGDPEGFRPDQNRIRANFAKLVNADVSEIVMVPSTQAGESFIASAVGLNDKGAHLVSDYLHFVGSQEMYTDMARRGLEVTWVKIKDNRIPLEDLDRAIIPGRTKLVAVSHTAFVNGFQHDLKRVSEIAHAKGATVYADIIQAAGNQPLDLTASGVDAACCATYKWLMSSGTAFLYVRKSSMEKMRPPFYHFSQYTRLLPETHMYPFDKPGTQIVDDYQNKEGAPGMFSMGYEPNTATLAGLEYSLPYIAGLGPEKIQGHVQTLTTYAKQELVKRGYTLMTPMDATSPIVTVVAQNAQQYAETFRKAGVKVTTRWNHIRISPSVYNDLADVERFLAAMPNNVG